MDPLNYMYPLPAVQSCHALSNMDGRTSQARWFQTFVSGSQAPPAKNRVLTPAAVSSVPTCIVVSSASSRARILSLSASSSTCCVLNEASHVFGVVGVSGMTVRERARHDHKYVPVRHGTTK